MKESGINYFFGKMGLDTGSFGVFYTFEEGAGSNINSLSGGMPQYSGTLSSATNFWVAPGSGFFSGNSIAVNNASGLDSITWTKIFVYEKVNTNEMVLFDSMGGGSGCKISILPTNKTYFESFNSEPVTAASNNNLSSKNAISVSYLTNYLTLGYYNWNSKSIESESFNYPFGVTRSDNWRLGGSTGYIDYFIHLTDYQSPDVIGQLLSGLWARQTGYGYETDTICTTGITGYQSVFVGETGITGYVITPGGDEGRDYYTGAFPTFHSEAVLTGYISSGLFLTGLTGYSCVTTTGNRVDLLEHLTGYASSFGMQKIQLFVPIDSSDIIKYSWDYTPFNNIYNKIGFRNYSGYQMAEEYPTGLINLFYNGVAQANSGWSVTGDYLILTGADTIDSAFYDLKSGDKKSYDVTGLLTGFGFVYSGQEIFLNGINLISGYDFQMSGSILNLTNRNTGIGGNIFEYPIVLGHQTGSFSVKTGTKFWRNTSNVYQNGVRLLNRVGYIEGAVFDLLSGDSFNYSGVVNIYDNTNLYWD